MIGNAEMITNCIKIDGENTLLIQGWCQGALRERREHFRFFGGKPLCDILSRFWLFVRVFWEVLVMRPSVLTAWLFLSNLYFLGLSFVKFGLCVLGPLPKFAYLVEAARSAAEDQITEVKLRI